MKAEYIKERDLIHRGLYMVDKRVVWFDSVMNHFYPLGEERRSLGFITRFQRSNEIACRIGKKDDRGFLTIWKNHHVHKIPLTKEIREKNGLEMDGCISRHESSQFLLQHWSEDKVVLIGKHGNPIFIPDIQYVHELQRALICCGLDDLAENFTV